MQKPDCVAFARVALEPRSTDYIGEITNGYVTVLVPNVDGWSLVKFGSHSGWIEATTMGGTTCTYQVSCISSSNGTWSDPYYGGTQLVGQGQAHRVEYTGHYYVDPSGTYREVYVTYPAPTRIAPESSVNGQCPPLPVV